MSTDRFQRALPLFGVLFAAVLVAGLALTSGEPDDGASRSEIFAYWHSHHGIQLVSNLLLIPFGVVFLLCFTAALRRAVRSGEAVEAVYSPLVLAGGVIASLGLLVTGMLGAAVATAAHHGARDATYTLAQLQSYDWVPWMVGFSVLLLASGIGGLRTHALPRWSAIAAVVLGALFLTPVGYFALFAFPLWPLATGIALYRRAAPRMRGAAIPVLTLLVVVLSAASAALATPPGKNGSIAFRRYFDDQHTWGAVFTVRPDGTGARQITHPPKGTNDDQPSWAPDGSELAFTRCAPSGGLCHIWTVGPDGSRLAPLGPLCPDGAHEQTCPDDGHPDFSPDSKQVVFVQSTGRVEQVPVTGQQIEHSAVAVMNRDGSNRRVVYTTTGFQADLDYPVFSPDARRVAFERHNSGLSKPVDEHAVFVVDVDGSNLRRLTPWSENDGDNPDWSPDGAWILYHSHVDDPKGQAQYFIVHPDGSGRRQISHFSSGTHVASASFAPDGTSIVFSKGPEGGNVDVFTMRLDGSHVRRLTRSKLWDSAPDWGAETSSPLREPAASTAAGPTGSWRVVVSKHDLLARGVVGSDVFGNYGAWNWTFAGGRFVMHQQESLDGPVVDRHTGVYLVRAGRVCLTDTAEHLPLGCFHWRQTGRGLTFDDPLFAGPIAQGDGPGIMRAVFTAHPWRRIDRMPASARP